MDLDALERALKSRRIAAVLAVTNFSNPLGCVMPDANKQRLVEMLAAREVPLVEDDLYGDLHFGDARPRAAKWRADRGRPLPIAGKSPMNEIKKKHCADGRPSS